MPGPESMAAPDGDLVDDWSLSSGSKSTHWVFEVDGVCRWGGPAGRGRGSTAYWAKFSVFWFVFATRIG